ncbi:MAG: bifunctional oligoribonuclease/PAP phosphatase NrnA [Acidobacteria bacterium]|nr:bifunctional oligoribonuclease/PAP phosphatase NrnA [Acidobacteriota bacterium]
MPATNPPDALLKLIRKGNRFLLTSHRNPDGDSIGSELGLARVLRRLGKSAVIWNRDATPDVYRQLPGSERIVVGDEPPAGFPDAFSAVIVLECPSLERTGHEAQLKGVPLVNIDHHLGNQLYGKVSWVDPAAPSAGEMVHRLAHSMTVELDADTATLLYLTLVTDTGGFRFSNATAAAFDAAADLVRQGAQPARVAHWVYESRPEPMVRLLGEMLQSLELHHGGKIATALLTPEMFERAGATGGDAEGLIDTPRSIAGVEAVAVIRRKDDSHLKVSLRSRGDVDVEKVAAAHGGGGHKNAAGCELEGDFASVRQRVVEELATAVDHAAPPAEA